MPAPVAAPTAADGRSNPLGEDGSSTTGCGASVDWATGWPGERSSSYAFPAVAAIEDGGGESLGDWTVPPAEAGMNCSTGRAEAGVAAIALAIVAPASAMATALFMASDDISTPSGCDRRVRSIEGEPAVHR